MADVVTTRTIANGASNLILHFTNLSDGTGESVVTKVDATSATFNNRGVAPGIYLSIQRIDFVIRSGGVELLWDATTDEDLAILNGEGFFDWTKQGGRRAPAVAGVTGSINLSTIGFMINSGYDITIAMTKNVPQL